MAERVELDAEYVHETPDAVLLDFGGDGEPVWMPKSVGEVVDGTAERGESVTVEVAEWWAYDKDLL